MTLINTQLRFDIVEKSQLLEARRATGDLAQRLGFGEVEIGKVALAVTEAATNLVKHARRGELLVRSLAHGDALGLEVLALDRGPGIADLAQSLRDGFSTAGSLGTGLGALSRLTDEFDIYSLPGKGTVVRLGLWNRQVQAPTGSRLDLGVVCQPMAGQEVCGDDWGCTEHQRKHVLAIADGLGHGPDAHQAARAAIASLHRDAAGGPAMILQSMHDASRPTRGSAVAVCELDRTHHVCRFAGVGNIACAVIVDATARRMVSYNGIAGHSMRKIQEFSVPWPDAAVLVMHSDGLSTHWDLSAYSGLSARHPAVIAAVLYRDFSRHRDDTTVLVAKQGNVPA